VSQTKERKSISLKFDTHLYISFNIEDWNSLNGKIPSELGLLSSLEVLDLSKFILFFINIEDKKFSLEFTSHVLDGNALTGPIPELLFQNGSNLEVVDFGAFFVVGCIFVCQRDAYL